MPYNIIVLVKVMPDLEQIKPDSEGNISTKNIPMRLETLSENSVEAAVQLKEKYGGKVTGLMFATQESASLMKKAYAMGVDEGVVITGYAGNNPAFTAKVLADKIRKTPHDIVLMGNQSADSYTGLLPGLIASELGYPLMGNVVRIELTDKAIKCRKFLESKNVDVESVLPSVVSVAQEINEPRLPPVMQIMAAGRKQIPTEAVSFSPVPLSEVISNRAPKSERQRNIYEKVEEGIPAVAKAIKEEMR